MQLPLAGHRHVLGVYLRPQWGRVLLLALLILLSIGLQLVNPQIIRYFIDATQRVGASPALVAAALLYLLVGLAQHGAALATVALSLDVGWRATNALRADLLRHVLGLDMTFHKAYTPGALIERVDGDVSALGDFFAQFLVRVAANVLLIAAILVIVLRTNALAGAALLVYTVLTVIVLVFVQRIGVVRWNAAREAWSDQMGFIEEHYAGAEDLRGVGAEPYVLYRLFGYMRALTEQARSGWMAQALGYALTNFLYVAGYALGLALGAWLYTQGQVTIGTAFVLVYYVGMLADPLEALRGQGEILQQATVGVRRVGSLLNQQSQIATAGTRTLPDGPLTVEVDTITFTYTDTDSSPQSPITPIPQHLTSSPPHPLTPTSPHLDTLSYTLPAGRTLGVLGRTGSGKTTLTRLLYRLYDPDDGTIRLDGVDLRAVAPDELRRRVGVVTQEVQLFHATLRDNITFFDTQVDDDAIEAALAELGLLDWVRAMPDGLDTMLASGGHGFSAGEAQLLAFTRLLLRDPGLVILDEAASRLDPVTERRLE
ncbi:MAG: ABC transporter ATP-binding protein, partial [Caldilineaceae bacterium]|nr:ABC transporter ATP-binding protein [Caldilineaceae bacterium]